MQNNKVAIYGDLTALYHARSEFRKSINYEMLDGILKSALEVDITKPIPNNNFYTAYSESNDKQISFINNTIRPLGWNVSTVKTRAIRRGKASEFRFDTDISYDLADSIEVFKKIMIVSDSFELHRSMERFHKEDPECELHLAFFSQSLDSRWWPVIHNPDSWVKFTDLDEKLYK